jgi:hypothetical protein
MEKEDTSSETESDNPILIEPYVRSMELRELPHTYAPPECYVCQSRQMLSPCSYKKTMWKSRLVPTKYVTEKEMKEKIKVAFSLHVCKDCLQLVKE